MIAGFGGLHVTFGLLVARAVRWLTPNAARRGRGAVEGTPRRRGSAPRPHGGSGSRAGGPLDHLIHHRMRLGIVSALAAAETLTFNELKAVLGATDGNLSVHARSSRTPAT